MAKSPARVGMTATELAQIAWERGDEFFMASFSPSTTTGLSSRLDDTVLNREMTGIIAVGWKLHTWVFDGLARPFFIRPTD